MKSPAKDTTITLPLSDVLEMALGNNYWHDRPIPKHVAEIVLAITKNHPDFGFHIQIKGRDGKELEEPVLWRYSAWSTSTELWLKAKNYSDTERSKRNIFEANVKMVRKAVERELEIRGDASIAVAARLVNKNQIQKLRAIGVEKLYTTENEIP